MKYTMIGAKPATAILKPEVEFNLDPLLSTSIPTVLLDSDFKTNVKKQNQARNWLQQVFGTNDLSLLDEAIIAVEQVIIGITFLLADMMNFLNADGTLRLSGPARQAYQELSGLMWIGPIDLLNYSSGYDMETRLQSMATAFQTKLFPFISQLGTSYPDLVTTELKPYVESKESYWSTFINDMFGIRDPVQWFLYDDKPVAWFTGVVVSSKIGRMAWASCFSYFATSTIQTFEPFLMTTMEGMALPSERFQNNSFDLDNLLAKISPSDNAKPRDLIHSLARQQIDYQEKRKKEHAIDYEDVELSIQGIVDCLEDRLIDFSNFERLFALKVGVPYADFIFLSEMLLAIQESLLVKLLLNPELISDILIGGKVLEGRSILDEPIPDAIEDIEAMISDIRASLRNSVLRARGNAQNELEAIMDRMEKDILRDKLVSPNDQELLKVAVSNIRWNFPSTESITSQEYASKLILRWTQLERNLARLKGNLSGYRFREDVDKYWRWGWYALLGLGGVALSIYGFNYLVGDIPWGSLTNVGPLISNSIESTVESLDLSGTMATKFREVGAEAARKAIENLGNIDNIETVQNVVDSTLKEVAANVLVESTSSSGLFGSVWDWLGWPTTSSASISDVAVSTAKVTTDVMIKLGASGRVGVSALSWESLQQAMSSLGTYPLEVYLQNAYLYGSLARSAMVITNHIITLGATGVAYLRSERMPESTLRIWDRSPAVRAGLLGIEIPLLVANMYGIQRLHVEATKHTVSQIWTWAGYLGNSILGFNTLPFGPRAIKGVMRKTGALLQKLGHSKQEDRVPALLGADDYVSIPDSGRDTVYRVIKDSSRIPVIETGERILQLEAPPGEPEQETRMLTLEQLRDLQRRGQ